MTNHKAVRHHFYCAFPFRKPPFRFFLDLSIFECYPHLYLFYIQTIINKPKRKPKLLHKSPKSANNIVVITTKYSCKMKIWRIYINESNRNRAAHRRSRQGCHSQRDTPYNENTRGRPDADNIDTRCTICVCFDGFIQENWTELKKTT